MKTRLKEVRRGRQRRRVMSVAVCGVLLLAAGALAQFVMAQSTGVAASQRFVTDELAFDYPAEWQATDLSDQQTRTLLLRRAGVDAEIRVAMLRQPKATPETLEAVRLAIISPLIEQIARSVEQTGGSVERVPARVAIGGVQADGTRLLLETEEGKASVEVYSLLLNERVVVVSLLRSERAAPQATPVWNLVLGSLRVGVATAKTGAATMAATPAAPPPPTASPSADVASGASAPPSPTDYTRATARIEEIGQQTREVLKLYAAGDYARAIPLAEKVLALAEENVGLPVELSQQLIAGPLNVLGTLYRASGDYRRAEIVLQRAISLYEQALGMDSQNLGAPLNNLATLYMEQGDYTRAETLLQRAVAIIEKAHGPDDPKVATALNNLAFLYDERDDYRRAEQLNRRALAIRERKLGPEHPDTAVSLNNLASIAQASGDLDRAEQLYRRVVRIKEKAQGPEHPDVATALNNLASLFDQRGDFLQAEPLFRRALAVNEKVLGQSHPEVAVVLDNLGLLLYAKGDYARAEELLQRGLKIREQTFGPEHPGVAKSLNNLATVYQERGELARAVESFERALKIFEKKVGTEHRLYASSLDNLAGAYLAGQQYERAEPLFARALAIREKVIGADSEEVGISLNNHAMLHFAKGEYARATTLHQRSLAVTERRLGSEHPTLATLLANLSVDYFVQNDLPRAVAARQRSSDIRERQLALLLTVGTEQQKQLFMASIAEGGDYSIFLHTRGAPNDPAALRLALTSILQRKGRVLDASSEQIAILRRRLRPEDRALLEELSVVRAQLSALVLKGAGQTPPEEYQAALAKLNTEAERLETAISTRSAEFRAQSQTITLDRVQAALPAGTALVEMAIYRPYIATAKTRAERWGAPRYVAYVLRSGATAPAWVELGEAAGIEQQVTALRAALADPRRTDARPLARALDETVMRPVRQLLGDTRQVFLSPDGALNLVPFAALVDERDRYLVENYSITYLTSGRDLLRLNVKTESRQGPIVFADPQFDTSGGAAGAASASITLTVPATTTATAVAATVPAVPEGSANRRSFDFTVGSARFARLPGTAGEAAALGALLPNARVLTAVEATEAALKIVAGPSLLHIATHGFFLPDQTTARAAATDTRGLTLGGQTGSENLLLRSGVALAGANGRQSANGEDGVLTALEAAGLDLWGTKLVVLSACETGIGEVKNGDGVYGLRRALVLAGSESQVMSLWQVSDAATRDLMVAYYRRLQSGEGRTEALRQVQLEMIRGAASTQGGDNAQRSIAGTLKDKSQTEDRRHPFYWASFIQSGEWKSLNEKSPQPAAK